MGMLTGDDQPAVLRGPMVGKYLKMFVAGVQWGELDCLILDLPPGTGDTQLTLAQSMPLSERSMVKPILGCSEGLTGAVSRLLNEAAEIAIRDGSEQISGRHIEQAIGVVAHP